MSTETLEVTAGPLVAGGDSLVRRQNSKTLFVEGALPGERVQVEVTSQRKDLMRGRVTSVVEAAPERIDPPCSVFKKGCGGCQWQHAETGSQHEYKIGIVKDALTRIAKLEPSFVRFGGAVSNFEYRTTLHLAVQDGRAALRRRHSNDLVTLDECLIAHPAIAELAVNSRFGDAEEVTLRTSVLTGERMAFVKGPRVDVHSRWFDLPSDVTVTTDGKKVWIEEGVLGRRFRLSARSFFQSGPSAAELLASTVDSLVPDDIDWIVDAYAGIGVLGAVAASKRACKLVAIEESRSAAMDAKHNLKDLDAEVVQAEVAEVELPGLDSPDVVIADPARSGLGPSASRSLANLKAEQIVLVSCDPASMARDANLLKEHGYQLNDVVVLDLFPQTHHVETVSVFER